MASRWGASRLRGLILRGAMSGEIEASALVLVAALPLINAGLAYVKFGPMWRRANQPARPEVLEAALCAIRQHFAGDLGLLVRVMPPAEPIWQDSWTESLARAGYRLYRPVPNPERYLVDLRLSEAEQTASLGAKWRANLRKSSTQLEIAEADAVRSLPMFMELYNSMSGRKRFADHHHIDYLPRFLVSAPAAMGVRVFVASANGQPVSASLIAGRGERAFVPLSASSADALPLRAGFALRWEFINRLRGSGCHWLDLGGTRVIPACAISRRVIRALPAAWLQFPVNMTFPEVH